MRGVTAAVAMALALMPAGSAGAARIGEIQYIGSWMVGAYSDDPAPQFTHCSGTHAYPSGVLLAFNMAPDSPSTITFYSAQWSLTEQAIYPLELSVDGVALGTMGVQAISAKKVAGLMPSDDSLLLQPLQRGHVLRVRMQDRDLEFALRDFARMADEVRNCARRNAPEMASRPSAANPPVVLPSAVPTPPTPAPASTATGKLVIPVTAEERADAEAILGDLMQAGAFPEAGPLPDHMAVKALRERIAAWKGPTTIGSFHIVHPQEAPDPDTIASLLIAEAADDCPGGVFTSGSVRDQEIAVRRVSTSCEISGSRPVYAYFFIMPNGKGLHYVVATYAVSRPERAQQAEDRLREVVVALMKQTLGQR